VSGKSSGCVHDSARVRTRARRGKTVCRAAASRTRAGGLGSSGSCAQTPKVNTPHRKPKVNTPHRKPNARRRAISCRRPLGAGPSAPLEPFKWLWAPTPPEQLRIGRPQLRGGAAMRAAREAAAAGGAAGGAPPAGGGAAETPLADPGAPSHAPVVNVDGSKRGGGANGSRGEERMRNGEWLQERQGGPRRDLGGPVKGRELAAECVDAEQREARDHVHFGHDRGHEATHVRAERGRGRPAGARKGEAREARVPRPEEDGEQGCDPCAERVPGHDGRVPAPPRPRAVSVSAQSLRAGGSRARTTRQRRRAPRARGRGWVSGGGFQPDPVSAQCCARMGTRTASRRSAASAIPSRTHSHAS